MREPGAGALTAAGYWYVFVSLPIDRLLTFRWLFRLFVWYSFLWRVSGLSLKLDALHPDRAGGLGFLKETPFVLLPIFLSQTVLLSGRIADHIWHEGVRLADFRLQIAGLVMW